RHLRQPRAIGPYFPDFIFPAAIRDKGDPAAVRRPAWNDVLRSVIGKTAQRCASAVGGEEVLLWFAPRKVNKALFIRREREKRVAFQALCQGRGRTADLTTGRVEADLPQVFAACGVAVNKRAA